MGIDDLFKNYQKKIGAYDKRLWERTIERKILNGLTNVQTRSAKPNTNLIDLDLVRGSSFTKAKPKHGFITVAKMATLRCIFVPFYAKWWLRETSVVVFVMIVYLYSAQLLNLSIYYSKISVNKQLHENICCAEVWIPFIMMWILNLVHSNIVATNSEPELCSSKFPKTKRYRKKRSTAKQTHIDKISLDSSTHSTSEVSNKRLNWLNWELNKTKGETKMSKSSSQQNKPDMRGNNGFQNINHFSSDEEKAVAKVESGITSGLHQAYDKSTDETIVSPINGLSKPNIDHRTKGKKLDLHYSTDSESDGERLDIKIKQKSEVTEKVDALPLINVTQITDSTCDTDDDGEVLSSPETTGNCYLTNRFMENEWMGITTNSEDCSCSSDLEAYSDTVELNHDHMAAAAILTPTSAKVSCTIWEGREVKKAELSVLEISSSIISKVESMPNSKDYFYFGLVVSTVYAIIPTICRICNHFASTKDFTVGFPSYRIEIVELQKLLSLCFGMTQWEYFVTTNIIIQRWILTTILFFLLCVAERTFKQRFLYAKLFSQLTSSQRARKSELPHFRLNKVRNIKTWLSVRSYLKKRGPQRSVDVIVSAAFIITLLLISFLCLEMVKDSISLNSQHHIEASLLCLGLGIILLRFMTLGTKINKKYRNLSVLITEQINLHLQIEQKPHKKEELTVANNVLKLAIDLLKELDNPFKISGLSANPILYNVTKVIILSALSGILSEMLGFKLKLHKIKIK